MEVIVECAWCGRVRLNGGWIDAKRAIQTLRTYDWPEPPRLSHGMCDSCFEEVSARRSPRSADKAAA